MSYAPIRSETFRTQLCSDFDYSLNKTHSARRREKASPKRNGHARKSLRPSRVGSSRNHPLIVHCHLCWDWVWQRPQQFVSRLSKGHKVLFVETIAPDPNLASPVARFS